jgi:Rrf2 family protein
MSVFSINKRVEYGLVMLSELAKKGKGKKISLAQLASRGFPRPFMAQIAKDLVAVGILGSKEGRGGGYYLNYDPGEIELGEILEAIDGQQALVDCVSGEGCPFEKDCLHKDFMSRLSEKIDKIFKNYTLKDLIK